MIFEEQRTLDIWQIDYCNGIWQTNYGQDPQSNAEAVNATCRIAYKTYNLLDPSRVVGNPAIIYKFIDTNTVKRYSWTQIRLCLGLSLAEAAYIQHLPPTILYCTLQCRNPSGSLRYGCRTSSGYCMKRWQIKDFVWNWISEWNCLNKSVYLELGYFTSTGTWFLPKIQKSGSVTKSDPDTSVSAPIREIPRSIRHPPIRIFSSSISAKRRILRGGSARP